MDELMLLRAVATAADHLVIEQKSSIYAVATSAFPTDTVQFLELSQSLDRLREFYNHGQIEVVAEVPAVDAPWLEGWIRPKSRPCESCGASIFFAHANTGRWLPLEPDPVGAGGVLPSWRYVVVFTDPPSVDTCPTVTSGPVWVDHRQTCGLREEGPRYKVKPYLKRWAINKARAENLGDDLSRSLSALRDRLDSATTGAEE